MVIFFIILPVVVALSCWYYQATLIHTSDLIDDRKNTLDDTTSKYTYCGGGIGLFGNIRVFLLERVRERRLPGLPLL